MLSEQAKEYITPILIRSLGKLIEKDSLDGVKLDIVIQYMSNINKLNYTTEEAIPYVDEFCKRGLLEKKANLYYTSGAIKKNEET